VTLPGWWLLPIATGFFILVLFYFEIGYRFKEFPCVLDVTLPDPALVARTEAGAGGIRIWIGKSGSASEPKPLIIIDEVAFEDWDGVRDMIVWIASAQGVRERPVWVTADGDALHGWVMRMLDYLFQLQFRDVRIDDEQT
jgi:hypothetical protein